RAGRRGWCPGRRAAGGDVAVAVDDEGRFGAARAGDAVERGGRILVGVAEDADREGADARRAVVAGGGELGEARGVERLAVGGRAVGGEHGRDGVSRV